MLMWGLVVWGLRIGGGVIISGVGVVRCVGVDVGIEDWWWWWCSVEVRCDEVMIWW